MNSPLISVIIPVYNVEKYLAECLDSCICQEMPDAEFICVNDGSTDQSADILKEYAEKDSRIRVVDKPNGGLSSARNAGVAASSGAWIVFLDSDDKLKENALQVLQDRISLSGSDDDRGADTARTEPDIIIYCADTFPVDIESEGWYKKTLQFPSASYSSFSPGVLFRERGSMPYVWRQAYRRGLLEESKVVFDESIKYGEDVLYQMEIFPQASRFEFIPDILLSYRLNREGSIMDNVREDPVRIVDNHYDMICRVAGYWKEKGWIDKYGDDFLYWALKFTILKVRALPSDIRNKKAEEMFDRIIIPYGLDRYRRKQRIKGRMMWNVFFAFSKF